MQPIWGRKTFLLVSGASKGIGKQCAIDFCKRIAPGSVALLAGRDTKSLEPVKKTILDSHTDSNFKVGLFAHDMEKPDGKLLDRRINEFLTTNLAKADDFDHAIIIHGATTRINPNIRVLDLDDPDVIGRYFTANTFAPVLMNAHFMKIFKETPKMLRTVVNITSDLAECAYRSLSIMSAASASRLTYMASTAKEHDGILVLNYNPGFVEPHMKGMKNCSDDEIQILLQKLEDKKRIIDSEAAVKKLMRILEGRQFFSGENVNFYDLL